jgi:hypothetical protein
MICAVMIAVVPFAVAIRGRKPTAVDSSAFSAKFRRFPTPPPFAFN